MKNELNEIELEEDLFTDLQAVEPDLKDDNFDPLDISVNQEVDIDLGDIFEEDKDNNKTNTDPDNTTDESFSKELLTNLGISDEYIVSVENEEGVIEDIKFSDLSKDEKIEVVREINTSIVDDKDMETYKELQKEGISLSELEGYYRNKITEELKEESGSSESYDIDQYSDEELYYLDMKSEFEDLPEEEIMSALEKELENETLFKLKAEKLRDKYKTREQEYIQLENDNKKALIENQHAELVQSVKLAAQEISSFDGIDIDLEDDDKEEVLNSILERDDNGVSDFMKTLEDPKELFRVAWLAKKSKDAFTGIQDYYKGEISKMSKGNKDNKKVVIKNKNNNKKPLTIDDLGF